MPTHWGMRLKGQAHPAPGQMPCHRTPRPPLTIEALAYAIQPILISRFQTIPHRSNLRHEGNGVEIYVEANTQDSPVMPKPLSATANPGFQSHDFYPEVITKPYAVVRLRNLEHSHSQIQDRARQHGI